MWDQWLQCLHGALRHTMSSPALHVVLLQATVPPSMQLPCIQLAGRMHIDCWLGVLHCREQWTLVAPASMYHPKPETVHERVKHTSRDYLSECSLICSIITLSSSPPRVPVTVTGMSYDCAVVLLVMLAQH